MQGLLVAAFRVRDILGHQTDVRDARNKDRRGVVNPVNADRDIACHGVHAIVDLVAERIAGTLSVRQIVKGQTRIIVERPVCVERDVASRQCGQGKHPALTDVIQRDIATERRVFIR